MQLHPQEAFCSRPASCSRVKSSLSTGSTGWWWSTVWRGWSNWESASPVAWGVPKRCVPSVSGRHRGQPLTLVSAKAGLPADTDGDSSGGSVLRTGIIHTAFDFVPAPLGQILTLTLLASASLPKFISLIKAFRPDF